MKLKDLSIDLTGCFKSDIEPNLIFICTGLFIESEKPFDIAKAFSLNILDENKSITTQIVLTVFVEKNDKVEFRYKKQVFEVISVSFEKIELSANGVNYFIERTNLI